jgi:hypothetical protein
MTRAEIVSTIALLVSIVSLSFSIYFNFRDRARLVTRSSCVQGWDPGTAHVAATVVNAGRRPIILRMWAGVDDHGQWVGTYFAHEKGGLRLAEHELSVITITAEDLCAQTPDGELWIKDMWIEDSLGRRYPIKDARKHIAELWKLRNAEKEERKEKLLLL